MLSRRSEMEGVVEAIRGAAPPRPGVYLFYDADGATIYVGKSVNLRQRMLSYFAAGRSGLERRLREMVFSVRGFALHETPTELLALLLEDALIKRERPRYNVRQQEYAQYCYLLLTDDRYPALRVVDGEGSSGTLFGPFRDRYLAAEILGIVRRHFHLRSCADPEPFQRSLNYDLGFCLGPCRGGVAPEGYGEVVDRVVCFLNGEVQWIAEALEGLMASLAETQQYEKAAEVREELSFCENFAARQRFIHQFKTRNLEVNEEGEEQVDYRFERGNLVSSSVTSGGVRRDHAVPDLLSEPLTDERFLLDRANLVYTWLSRPGLSSTHEFS